MIYKINTKNEQYFIGKFRKEKRKKNVRSFLFLHTECYDD